MNPALALSLTICLLAPAAYAAGGVTEQGSVAATATTRHHHLHKTTTHTTTETTRTTKHGAATLTHSNVTRSTTVTKDSFNKGVPHHHPAIGVVSAPRIHHPARLHPVQSGATTIPTKITPPPQPAAPTALRPPEPDKGAATGLPLPRFAALRSDQVNFRAGPGTRYPIDWIYQRRDLPVRIEREFEVWRLVSEVGGTKGWVHQATLTGRRSFVITGDQPQALRAAATASAATVAMLKPGVVGQIQSCAAGSDWCAVSVKAYHGYLSRAAFWGALPGEVIGP